MRVAIANQKGGVGKTTTAINLAAALNQAGHKILVVDLDPQANATTGIGIDHRQLQISTYEVLIEGVPVREAILKTAYDGLDLVPGSIDLAGAELELVASIARETKLRVALEGLADGYDVVFIDCPPSLGLLTVNGMTAAEFMLVPIQCEYYALEGLSQLLRNIELVRSGLNPSLEIGGIVLTMYDARTKLSEEVAEEVRGHFREKVFQTVIPRSVRLSEAPSYGQPAVTYDSSSRGSMAYRWLAEEFAERFLVVSEPDGPAGGTEPQETQHLGHQEEPGDPSPPTPVDRVWSPSTDLGEGQEGEAGDTTLRGYSATPRGSPPWSPGAALRSTTVWAADRVRGLFGSSGRGQGIARGVPMPGEPASGGIWSDGMGRSPHGGREQGRT